MLGEQTESGPCRGLATPAAGEADGGPIIDDLDLDFEVHLLQEEGALGVLRNLRRVVAKEEGELPEVPSPFATSRRR